MYTMIDGSNYELLKSIRITYKRVDEPTCDLIDGESKINCNTRFIFIL